MKRIAWVLVIIFLLVLICSYFIPVTRQKQVFVANTFENIISSVTDLRHWTKWNSEVRQAWRKDSSACQFRKDPASPVSTIDVPGRKISITALSFLLYQIEETHSHGASVFTFSITPYVGNGQPRSQHNSTIAYAHTTNLLSVLLPFLDYGSFAEKTIADLVSYLQDNSRFYGFPIELKQAADTFFLTQKARVSKNEFFTRIPAVFTSLEQFAKDNQCIPGHRNISFGLPNNDSLDILAGVNIDKIANGDGTSNFMQLPSGQILLTGYFQGPFFNRPLLYKAMEKYLLDHQLVKGGASFEKYLSPLPLSDSSMIQVELSYPLRY